VSLRDPAATGAEADTLVTTQHALVSAYDWVFLVGPNLMPAVNGVLLGTLLYRSRLVPRAIPLMGLVGGPLLLAVTVASIVGLTHHGSAWWVVAAPIVVWELWLGIYLTFRGFKTPPVLVGMPPASAG
jgi:hypothetical protein